MIAVRYNKSDSFVSNLQRKGVDVRWDGWDMVFFRPEPRARWDKNGRVRNGVYGYETTVSANKYGKWMVGEWLTGGKSIGR